MEVGQEEGLLMKKGILILLACVLMIGMVAPAWAQAAPVVIAEKAPAKPAALKALALEDGRSIQLTWSAGAGENITYEVQRKSGSKWKSLRTTNELTYTDSGLKLNTKYSYRVRSIQNAEKGAFASVSAKTKNPVTSVSLNKSAVTVYMGTPLTLKATIKPSKATDKALTWTSGNPAIAKVSAGKVTPVALGQTTITVSTANGKSASCAVTVKLPNPKSIALSKTKATLLVGGTLALKPTVKPAAADQAVSWKSSNNGVATVTAEGVVTAIKAGTAKITATTVNGKKKVSTITVKTHVTMGKNDLKYYFNGKLYTIPSTYASAKKLRLPGYEREYYGREVFMESDDGGELNLIYNSSGKKLVRATFYGKEFRTYRGIAMGDPVDKLLAVYGMPDLYHRAVSDYDHSVYYTFLYKFSAGGTYYMAFEFSEEEEEIFYYGIFTMAELNKFLED